MNNFKNGYIQIPKYLKKYSMFPIFISKPIIVKIKEKEFVKLPFAELTKSSKIFHTIFEDELINCFIKDSALKETFDIYLKIPRHLHKKQIFEITIKPLFKGIEYEISYTYQDEIIHTTQLQSSNKIMAIDLGINNLASIITSDNNSFIIDGKRLKSINQYYNKQLSHYQSKNKIKSC